MTLRDDGTGDVVVAGLTEVAAKSASEALEALEAGNSLRATEAPSSNLLSSRSHAICQLVCIPPPWQRMPHPPPQLQRRRRPAASPLEERECDTEKKAGVAASRRSQGSRRRCRRDRHRKRRQRARKGDCVSWTSQAASGARTPVIIPRSDYGRPRTSITASGA